MRQLEYKATKLAKVDRFFPSSARCHVCGQINEALRLSERAWVCPNPQCGTEHERDLNAAINILLEGLRLLAGTGWVGVSGVEFATATRSFGFAQAADCEAGSI
jgi:transposase